MRDMASGIGEGHHYIYNLQSGQLTLWFTSMVRVGERRFLSTRQVDVAPAVEKYWRKLLCLSEEAGTSSVHMTVSYAELVDHSRHATTSRSTRRYGQTSGNTDSFSRFSAWRVVDPVSAMHQKFLAAVETCYEEKGQCRDVDPRRVSLVKAILANSYIGFQGKAFSVRAKFKFKDDSRIDVMFDPETQRFITVNGKARDAEGNRIPITMYDVSGGKNGQAHYAYPDTNQGRQDYAKFEQRISVWGIQVVGNPVLTAEGYYAIVCAGVRGGVECNWGSY